MEQSSGRFANPPIVEVVLGVQFTPLASFSNAHLGWFWKRYLEDDWVIPQDAALVADQFETFAAQDRRGRPELQFQVSLGLPVSHTRLQITNEAGDRMIQVQSTRFHYNWLKKNGMYPSYKNVRKGFDDYYSRFCNFASEAGLGTVTPNQWELTYVNQIPRGKLWESPMEWHKVLPGLIAPGPEIEGIGLESAGGDWHYEIVPKKGRLHFSFQYGRVGEQQEPALVLQTTARGPIGKNGTQEFGDGLDLGHEVVNRAFLRLTSPEAQKIWEGL
jgi:uncharacterized protein (TIGR04255 family)